MGWEGSALRQYSRTFLIEHAGDHMESSSKYFITSQEYLSDFLTDAEKV